MTQWNFSNAVATCKADKSIQFKGSATGYFDSLDRPTMLQVKPIDDASAQPVTLHWPDYELSHA